MSTFWIKYLPDFIKEKVEGRHELQKAIGNTGWLFADNILRMGVGLLVSVWVTRYLGPEQFGALSYATAFVFVFSSISMLGLDWIVVRNIAALQYRNHADQSSIISTILVKEDTTQ